MGKRKTTEEASPTANEDEAKLLGIFLQYHMEEQKNITFEVAAAGPLDCHKSNNRWRAVWKSLKEQGLIEAAASGKGFQISEAGIKSAETPEYREFLKDKNFIATTNEEHQERLKKRFKKKKSEQIFNLLQCHGSLSRYELAGLVKEKDRSHSFSYSLQELKKAQLVEADTNNSQGRSKKLRLSDKAFLKPQDRPEPQELSADVLAKAVEENAAPRSVKAATKKNKGKPKEDINMEEGDEDDFSPEQDKKGKKAPSKKESVKKESVVKKGKAQVKDEDDFDSDGTKKKEASSLEGMIIDTAKPEPVKSEDVVGL